MVAIGQPMYLPRLQKVRFENSSLLIISAQRYLINHVLDKHCAWCSSNQSTLFIRFYVDNVIHMSTWMLLHGYILTFPLSFGLFLDKDPEFYIRVSSLIKGITAFLLGGVSLRNPL